MTRLLSRRTVLRGAGAAVALPWLSAMAPSISWASTDKRPPVRMAIFYMGNGALMKNWTPAEVGALPAELPPILQPLAGLRNEFSVLSGLSNAGPASGGPGAHARSMAAFLTCVRPRKTEGPDYRSGVSMDQIAATALADKTILPSLEMGMYQSHGLEGPCDLGYACAYMHVSWRDAVTPVEPLNTPQAVFNRLFSTDARTDAKRQAQRRSILDFVRGEAQVLEDSLGPGDRRKLDEYFTSIRELEQRIERIGRFPAPQPPGIDVPQGNHDSWRGKWEEQIRLQSDLMALAFKADITRVCTFTMTPEFRSFTFPALGFSEDHHHVSHHQKNPDKMEKFTKICTYHSTQIAYVLGALKGIEEGDGSLLDNSMLLFGGGMSDDHHNEDLPIILAGRGGGTLQPGRHVRVAANTPVSNLWRSMLDRLGTPVERLGDSSGLLPEL